MGRRKGIQKYRRRTLEERGIYPSHRSRKGGKCEVCDCFIQHGTCVACDAEKFRTIQGMPPTVRGTSNEGHDTRTLASAIGLVER